MSKSVSDRAALHTVSGRRVTNGDVELAVFEQGPADGETIVLVHGWPDTHGLWQHVVPLLADTYRVVSYDSRGSGESTTAPRVQDYLLSAMADDLFAVIDAVSPGEPVHVLAHDWGSVTAWEAVCEPGAEKKIASFTSISGPNLDHLGKWMRASAARRRFAGPAAQAVASAYTVLFQIPGLCTLPLRFWFSQYWPAFLGFFDGLDPRLVNTAPTLAADMVTGLKLYRANIRPSLGKPRNRYTDVPVQLVLNRNDKAVRPVGYQDTEKWVSDLQRREIVAGHWSPISHAGEVAAHTRAFISSLLERRSEKQTS